MKSKTLTAILMGSVVFTSFVQAQETKEGEFKPYGKVTGYAFGDYAYKVHADSATAYGNVNGKPFTVPGTGNGSTQYQALKQGYNSFNLRRIYLGYNYYISERFETQLTLAHESGNESNTTTDPSLTSDGKRSVYIKYANLKWKNIYKNADLVIGQQMTPTFATLSEKIWAYRSIEKTVADMRGISSSTDLGVGLFGKFDKDGNYGYDVLIANGQGAKLQPLNNAFKKYYTSLYAYFLNKKVVVQVNYEYQTINAIGATSTVDAYKQSKSLYKGFVAYNTPKFTVGIEAYTQMWKNYVTAKGDKSPSMSINDLGLSLFLKGSVITDKLNYFARYDMINPDTKYDDAFAYSASYDARNKQSFITAGLDFMPAKNVHIMPNIWFNTYTNQQSVPSLTGSAASDYDLVARLTFHYIFQ